MPRPRKPCQCGSVEYDPNCPECLIRQAKRKLTDTRIAQGLCPHCGNQRAPGGIHCEKCLENVIIGKEIKHPSRTILPKDLRKIIRKARRKEK